MFAKFIANGGERECLFQGNKAFWETGPGGHQMFVLQQGDTICTELTLTAGDRVYLMGDNGATVDTIHGTSVPKEELEPAQMKVLE